MKDIEYLRKLEKNEQHRLGISDETLSSMKQYFLKTSVPRIIKERREKQNEEESKLNKDTNQTKTCPPNCPRIILVMLKNI